MALTRLTNFVARTKILSAAVNSEFNSYLTFINNLIHKDGSVAMVADLELNYATPAILWDGTEGSAVQWRIIEDGGDFSVQYESTGWQDFMVMNSSPASMALPSALTLILGNISIQDGDPYIEWDDTEKWRISQDSTGDLLVELDDSGFGEVAKFDAATESLELQQNLTVNNDLTVLNDTDVSAGTLTVADDAFGFDQLNYREEEATTQLLPGASGTWTYYITYQVGDVIGIEPIVIVEGLTLTGSVYVNKRWLQGGGFTMAVDFVFTGTPGTMTYKIYVLQTDGA